MIAASYHDTVNVLQGVCQPAPSPFERPEWFGLLASSGLNPLVVQCRDADRIVALALREAGNRIEPLRNWYSFTWRPLVPRGQQADKLLDAIADQLRRRTSRVILWPVPDEDGSATRLADAFRRQGWLVTMEQCDHNHVLPVAGRSFADYWASRPGRLRTTLSRKAKKVTVEILTRFDDEVWAHYEAIYSESWKPAEETPDLLRRFAEQEGAAGRIRLGIAWHDGQAAAAQFWTVENGTAYIHKLAHRDSLAHLSAGTTLTAALFERVIDADRVELVDFGTGNDRYKADWMELVRPRYRIDCRDPRQPRAWPGIARAALAQMVTRLAPPKARS